MDSNVTLVKDDNKSNQVNQAQYQSMVGSLMYASTATRPDIAFAVGRVSKFSSAPTTAHLTAVKRIFRYLKGTMHLGLGYEKTANVDLIGYSDADWAGDHDDRHATSGQVFLMGNGAVSWSSRKQSLVTLSTSEAEYVALSLASQEAIWLRRLMSDICESAEEPTNLFEDNQGTIAMAKNPVSHSRTKHIDIKYHYVGEAIQKKEIQSCQFPLNINIEHKHETSQLLSLDLSSDSE
ncbi:uncharacterized protein LOC135340191 [Halichondria panicea]|uniref:uncharacterized protein LOC135340191 n=1 Tax=Halichondria panicea TaxID=6063 RepID=UPI00312BBA4D